MASNSGEPFNETNFHAINLDEVAPHNMDALNTMLSDYIIDKDNQEHNEQVRWKALIFFDEWQGGTQDNHDSGSLEPQL